jgi:hypothetical protein
LIENRLSILYQSHIAFVSNQIAGIIVHELCRLPQVLQGGETAGL